MAENKVSLGIEVSGVEQSINSIKDLKDAIKAAKDEQVRMASTFGEGSKEYLDATKNLGELKDKMDDLNDSTQSLRGSGIESLSSSLGMLGDGLKNFDFEKVKTGFKGIGSAMNAIPLMLLVSGITMLMEKFDIFGKITEVITDIIYAFTDAIGLTNKADEKAAAEMIENSKKVQKQKEEQYDAEIKKAKAAGQDTKELELQKLKATENSIAQQVKSLEDLKVKKGKLNDEEQENYEELQSNLLKASSDREAKEIANNKEKVDKINAYNAFSATVAEDLRVSKLSEREKEIDAIRKASAEKLKELNEKQSVDSEAEYKRFKETEKQINELAQIEINKINSKYYQEDLEKRKAKLEEINRINAEEADAWWAQRLEEEAQITKEQEAAAKAEQDELDRLARLGAAQDEQMARFIANKEKEIEINKQAAEKKAADEKAALNGSFQLAQQSLAATQQLSDLFFEYKKKNLKKGSAEEIKAAEQQFKVNKALQIANAVITGIQGVMAAYSSGSAIPIIGAVAGPAFAILAGIAAAANIAKIASAKFNPGATSAPSSVGDSGGSAPPVPAPPTISTPNANVTGTKFDESGKKIENTTQTPIQVNVKAQVVETEMTDKQRDVKQIQTQSTF